MDIDWNVLEHGELHQLSEGVWRVEGALPRVSLRRQMIVVRNGDGDMLLHSAIALDEARMEALQTLGNLRWLVIPSRFHRLDAARYKARFPKLTVIAPEGAHHKMPVDVDMTYAEFDGGSVRGVALDGTARREGVIQVRDASGTTLVFNDLIFNQPPLPGLTGVVMRMGGAIGGPRITPLEKMLIVKDKRVLADELRALAEMPDLKRVIPAHIDGITENPSVTLRRLAGRLHQ